MATSAAPRHPKPSQADERAYYDEERRVYRSWFASVYDLICLPLRGLRRRVARCTAIEPGMRVIDVATGTGAQAGAFAELGATVVGVDLSSRMLAIARRKHGSANATFVEGDATALPVASASFDAACISFALHEMPEDVRRRALAELVRVTRPGGTIAIVDYAPPRTQWWRTNIARIVGLFERESYREFVRSDLLVALRAAGIEVLDDHRALFGAARIIIGTHEA